VTPLIYRDPSQPIERRVDDLLGRMTLAEKVGQMMQLDGREDPVAQVERYQPGSLLHLLNEALVPAIDAAQATRLGIPLLIGEDAIHGHSFHQGATIFPSPLGMACSWDPDLLRDVGRVTAREMTPTGAIWTFSPVLCIARDARWGRVGETFGEDPLLIGELGAAMIEGYQGDGLSDPDSVLATAKHYAGYSETQGGLDASEADLSQRKLRSYFLPPFERAARAGCRAFMTGYQSIDGLPSTASRWLLTEVLREEWGFSGIVVTDWDNVGRLHWGQKIVPSLVEASVVAVRAGNDVIMVTPGFLESAQEAVRRGLLAEAEIDAVVRRILRLKFELGLFENPRRPDRARQAEVIGCAAHRELALRAARESIVLLENDGFLPLEATKLGRIAVLGPNADDDLSQLGDWSLGATQYPPERGKHPRELTVTLLDGIRQRAGFAKVGYERAVNVTDRDLSGLERARALVSGADVALVVVGDHLDYIGEMRSSATLELLGGQAALIDAIAESGTPFVLVLVNSKPLVLPESARRARAVLECFNPGMLGGQALAEILFGDLCPSGKLPVSFPRHAGQIPVYYNQLRNRHGGYVDLPLEPAYSFGFGLSYTRFSYSNLQLAEDRIEPGRDVSFEVDVQNEGARDGVEIVQAYVHDVVTSVTWPKQMLVAFTRVGLAAGERRRVRFEVPHERLSLVDARGVRTVEPGEFELRVGSSSRETDQITARFEVSGLAFSFERLPGIAAW
jgi:beta-glucosidase